MKIVFNDAGELQVQAVRVDGGRLHILTTSAMVAELKEKFADEFACRKMQVAEDGKVTSEYTGYTELYRIEEYRNGVLGVLLDKSGTSDIQDTAVEVVRMMAQDLTDAQALSVKVIYPVWEPDVVYSANFKIVYNDILYRTLKAHTSRAAQTPDVAASLYTKVLIPDPDIIPEWEQPESTNPYGEGDRVTHNGKTWVSECDNNVWEPGDYGWSEV